MLDDCWLAFVGFCKLHASCQTYYKNYLASTKTILYVCGCMSDQQQASTPVAAAAATSKTSSTDEVDVHVFACPHACGVFIGVGKNEICCGIFRCGVNLSTNTQLEPHASQVACQEAVASGKVVGCGKPFKFDGQKASICGYI